MARSAPKSKGRSALGFWLVVLLLGAGLGAGLIALQGGWKAPPAVADAPDAALDDLEVPEVPEAPELLRDPRSRDAGTASNCGRTRPSRAPNSRSKLQPASKCGVFRLAVPGSSGPDTIEWQ